MKETHPRYHENEIKEERNETRILFAHDFGTLIDVSEVFYEWDFKHPTSLTMTLHRERFWAGTVGTELGCLHMFELSQWLRRHGQPQTAEHTFEVEFTPSGPNPERFIRETLKRRYLPRKEGVHRIIGFEFEILEWNDPFIDITQDDLARRLATNPEYPAIPPSLWDRFANGPSSKKQNREET